MWYFIILWEQLDIQCWEKNKKAPLKWRLHVVGWPSHWYARWKLLPPKITNNHIRTLCYWKLPISRATTYCINHSHWRHTLFSLLFWALLQKVWICIPWDISHSYHVSIVTASLPLFALLRPRLLLPLHHCDACNIGRPTTWVNRENVAAWLLYRWSKLHEPPSHWER